MQDHTIRLSEVVTRSEVNMAWSRWRTINHSVYYFEDFVEYPMLLGTLRGTIIKNFLVLWQTKQRIVLINTSPHYQTIIKAWLARRRP